MSNSKAGAAATMQEMIQGTKQLKNEANCSGQQIGELQETWECRDQEPAGWGMETSPS